MFEESIIEEQQILFASRSREEDACDILCRLIEFHPQQFACPFEVYFLVLQNFPLGESIHEVSSENEVVSFSSRSFEHQQSQFILFAEHHFGSLLHHFLVIRSRWVEIHIHSHAHRRRFASLQRCLLKGRGCSIARRRLACRRIASRRIARRRIASRRIASRRIASRRIACRCIACRCIACRCIAWHATVIHLQQSHFLLGVTLSDARHESFLIIAVAEISVLRSRENGAHHFRPILIKNNITRHDFISSLITNH